jgi:putative membrane protein
VNDHEFIAEAVRDGLTEFELGRLGAAQAFDERVKRLAWSLMEEHEKANRELVRLAKRKRLEIPTEMDPERRSLIDDLKGLGENEFEQAYMRAVVKDHQRSISIFLKESQTGRDEEVRNFAGRLLSVLDGHLRTAKSITG